MEFAVEGAKARQLGRRVGEIRDLLGSGGSVIMMQEGETYMREVIEKLKTKFSPSTKEEPLNLSSEELAATGWGVYNFNRDKNDQNIVILEGTNLPFERTPKPNPNWFLMGMLIAVIESIFEAKAES
jgi:hypothetical protein